MEIVLETAIITATVSWLFVWMNKRQNGSAQISSLATIKAATAIWLVLMSMSVCFVKTSPDSHLVYVDQNTHEIIADAGAIEIGWLPFRYAVDCPAPTGQIKVGPYYSLRDAGHYRGVMTLHCQHHDFAGLTLLTAAGVDLKLEVKKITKQAVETAPNADGLDHTIRLAVNEYLDQFGLEVNKLSLEYLDYLP